MTEDIFLLLWEHFIKHTLVEKYNPIFLILDNHQSHISLRVRFISKRNKIVLFSFPPYITHKLQPLDRPINGTFKKFVNS
jgi:hypothetical protein